MPLYREDLELSHCDFPGCTETSHTDEIYFHPRCHFESSTWVRYRGDVLTIECAVCGKEVASIVVASRAHEPSEHESGAEPEDEDRCP